MSVERLVILLVNVVYALEEEVEEGVEVGGGAGVVVLDTEGAQVMVGAHVLGLQDVAVLPLVGAATADLLLLLTVLVKSCLMPMETVSGSDAAAGVDVDTFRVKIPRLCL